MRATVGVKGVGAVGGEGRWAVRGGTLTGRHTMSASTEPNVLLVV